MVGEDDFAGVNPAGDEFSSYVFFAWVFIIVLGDVYIRVHDKGERFSEACDVVADNRVIFPCEHLWGVVLAWGSFQGCE